MVGTRRNLLDVESCCRISAHRKRPVRRTLKGYGARAGATTLASSGVPQSHPAFAVSSVSAAIEITAGALTPAKLHSVEAHVAPLTDVNDIGAEKTIRPDSPVSSLTMRSMCNSSSLTTLHWPARAPTGWAGAPVLVVGSGGGELLVGTGGGGVVGAVVSGVGGGAEAGGSMSVVGGAGAAVPAIVAAGGGAGVAGGGVAATVVGAAVVVGSDVDVVVVAADVDV